MKKTRIFLLILIIIGIVLLLTQKIWVEKLVDSTLSTEKETTALELNSLLKPIKDQTFHAAGQVFKMTESADGSKMYKIGIYSITKNGVGDRIINLKALPQKPLLELGKDYFFDVIYNSSDDNYILVNLIKHKSDDLPYSNEFRGKFLNKIQKNTDPNFDLYEIETSTNRRGFTPNKITIKISKSYPLDKILEDRNSFRMFKGSYNVKSGFYDIFEISYDIYDVGGVID